MVDLDSGVEELQEESEVEAGQEVIRQTIAFENAKKKFQANKKKYSRLLVLITILMIILVSTVYLISPISNVKSVKINGNNVLADEYIRKVTGIDYNTKYVFLISPVKQAKANSSELIDNCEITKGRNHTVVINVDENSIVGYQYEDKMELILGDGRAIEFESNYIKNLALLPMFMSVPEDKLSRIATELGKLKFDTMVRISEVRDFALSYDYDMVKFVMEDGYSVYCSINGIDMLDQYLEILKNTSSKHKCILMDTSNNVAILRDCKELESLYQDALTSKESAEVEEPSTSDDQTEKTQDDTSETTET